MRREPGVIVLASSPAPPAFLGERLREALDPELGGAIDALAGETHDGGLRAGQQDRTAAPRPEFGQEFPDEQERGPQVHGQHLVPLGVRRLLDAPDVEHRGAVDEQREISPRNLPGAGGRGEGRLPAGEIADQGMEGAGPAPRRGLDRCPEFVSGAVEQDALGALLGEAPGRRGAESARRPGHQDAAPPESFAHQPGSTPRSR